MADQQESQYRPRKPPTCRPCGRPRHRADVICPTPSAPNLRYLVAPGFLGTEPTRWDEALADAWIQITLERLSRMHDELAPDCDIDTIEWDRAEALVNASYLMRNRQGLRDALNAYEKHAWIAFATYQHGEKAKPTRREGPREVGSLN